jgi:hypothetical protein
MLELTGTGPLASPEELQELLNIEPSADLRDKIMARLLKREPIERTMENSRRL